MSAYVFDLEVFEALFTATFISAHVNQLPLLKEYEEADIAGNTKLKAEILSKLDHKIFKLTHDFKIDDIRELAVFIINEQPTLYGFNNHAYDDLILNAVLIYAGSSRFSKSNDESFLTGTQFLRDISDRIIERQGGSWYYEQDDILKQLGMYKKPYYSIDLKKLNYISSSLKFIAILLKYYKIQDLPYVNIKITTYERWVITGEVGAMINEIIDYNINDVIITKYLLHFSKEELRIRIDTRDIYGIDVLSDSRSSMANKLISKYYTEVAGHRPDTRKQTVRHWITFGKLVEPIIQFKNKELKDFLHKLNNTVFELGHDTFKPSVIFRGVKYKLGVGGIHSDDRGINIECDDTYDLWDVDADSYYPRTILNYKVHPLHIPAEYYLPMVETILNSRLDAKTKSKNKLLDKIKQKFFEATAYILKIVVNIIYGKLGDINHWLLDHAAMYKTTLNCQLGMLKLVEMITDGGFEVLSANTDGVVTKVPKDKVEKYKAICEEWCKLLNYTVSYTKYVRYYGTSVNNYVAVKENGELKEKGLFTIDPTKSFDYLQKGYNHPIVSRAVTAYFVDKVPIADTIINHIKRTDLGYHPIHDYCIAQKIGSGYKPYIVTYNSQTQKLQYKSIQHTIRYYVAKTGDTIVKGKSSSIISLVAKRQVKVFNNFEYKDDYDIDYSFYLGAADGIINRVNRNITSKNKKQTGKLFDI